MQYSLRHRDNPHWTSGNPWSTSTDLERLVKLQREMVDLVPDNDRELALNNLGNALYSLFQHSRSVSGVQEAISMHREVLRLRPHPHPDRHHSPNNLGIALYSLFPYSQSVSDIEEAISMHRELNRT